MSNAPGIITVGFYMRNNEGVIEPMVDEYTGEEMTISFDLREDPFVWSRSADADDECDQDGHLHWNAATGMFYRDGVFSWEEYGPKHSEEEILDMVANGEGGVRKAVTHGVADFAYFLDHHDMLLKIVETK
ncbi:hypothetical protein [Thalassomonas actiniarum]|uniref:Uncharacterized protein n=1 Tax=Thalassomonas actiniarum TaxID=485447 RepID=A0AAE9YWN2_9GAMM|nr:hypothetical protein [Thalassomonas actiniarum]WDE02556.1 hypothetical protein SG35_029570 [Thalassomonas actiniarum]